MNKKKLKTNASKNKCTKLENAFIVEDLTPLRSKLLWYAKNKCNGKFKNCHTRSGRITAQLAENDNWVTMSNPDDFYKHVDSIDLDVINNGLRKIQILKDVALPNVSQYTVM